MEKFSLEEIDKTFTNYKKGQIFDGVVVTKRPDGLIFNIGGKNDAFIPVSDFDNYDEVKIGERFKVIITKQKNDEGFIEASKRDAQELIVGTQNAQKLKLGSRFSFVATSGEHGLHSKMGEFEIFVPITEISTKYVHNTKDLVGKQFEAVVTEYDRENKKIIASIKLLQEQVREQCENLFWNSIFVNKVVSGKVKKILPYGIFVDVDGVDCFCHISNLSYEKIESPESVVKEGETYQFKVIELDRESKKVALGLKQLQESPRERAIKEVCIGETHHGEVIKLLAFGAIIKLENGATGLLHISNATENKQKNIYEIVRVGDKVDVEIISKDEENQKLSFRLKS